MEDTYRRALLAAGLAGAALLPAVAQAQGGPLVADIPIAVPRCEFVYEAIVDIAPTMNLGEGPAGERRMVPITGGTFAGPRLRGRVLAGGADRQLWRKDGVRQLDALYEMQAEDGAVITVHNKVVVAPVQGAPDYRFSTIELVAPEGPHAWLNRLASVGTLTSLRPQREAVLVRVFSIG
ncbi:DUF3237 domain-containing protein [Falsiroseomonas sp. HW251]|uniref:DUF3237 domain-containing protein n=1 Tax=Falsiroseomonas sp. HW251 TaxID=3390998 RepID=UPI003D30FD61